jgi:hypothetical protein
LDAKGIDEMLTGSIGKFDYSWGDGKNTIN